MVLVPVWLVLLVLLLLTPPSRLGRCVAPAQWPGSATRSF